MFQGAQYFTCHNIGAFCDVTLPDGMDAIAQMPQFPPDPSVSAHVVFYLVHPELFVALGGAIAFRATVPKAAIGKKRIISAWKRKNLAFPSMG